jgi:phosphoglycerate dehydrogenase-like enzyme
MHRRGWPVRAVANAAREGVICEALALVTALSGGVRTEGALDIYVDKPPALAGLFGCGNVVLLPQIASSALKVDGPCPG